VEFPRGRVRPILVWPGRTRVARRLAGRTIRAVDRRGKRLLVEFAPEPAHGGRQPAARDTAWLVIEPRMTGLMLLVPPPTETHVRLVLSVEPAGGRRPVPRRLVFWDRRGLGTVRLVDHRGLERLTGPAVLGPDGLVVTADELAERLGASHRAVKVALLDQRAVAGIGNIYAAELLHRAGIDPRTPCRRLRAEAWEQIATATRQVLAEAVRLEGSSIGDRTYRTVDARVGRFQRRHRVYGRAGEPCRRCGGTIERIVQAQRSTFFCPECCRRARAACCRRARAACCRRARAACCRRARAACQPRPGRKTCGRLNR
jgi:formamidopyrimidine-DNA glycosylase